MSSVLKSRLLKWLEMLLCPTWNERTPPGPPQVLLSCEAHEFSAISSYLHRKFKCTDNSRKNKSATVTAMIKNHPKKKEGEKTDSEGCEEGCVLVV